MEENSEKNLPNEDDFEDFKDFDSAETVRPEIEEEEIQPPSIDNEPEAIDEEPAINEQEEDLMKEAELLKKLAQEHIPEGFTGSDEDILNNTEIKGQEQIETPQEQEEALNENNEANKEDKPEETAEETAEKTEIETEEITEKTETEEKAETEEPQKHLNVLAQPEEIEHLDNDDSVFKKYIFYVSKDFVPIIDNLSTDERTAYINDAIQRKVDSEYEYTIIDRRRRILTHIITMIITFFVVAPVILFLVHKSIMLTFDNYKYSQDNFEKLYKQRFEQDRAYMRSIEYNRIHNKEFKNEK